MIGLALVLGWITGVASMLGAAHTIAIMFRNSEREAVRDNVQKLIARAEDAISESRKVA